MNKPQEPASDRLAAAIDRRKEKLGLNSQEESAQLQQGLIKGTAKVSKGHPQYGRQ